MYFQFPIANSTSGQIHLEIEPKFLQNTNQVKISDFNKLL